MQLLATNRLENIRPPRVITFEERTPPDQLAPGYLQRLTEAESQEEIVDCLTKLAGLPENYPSDRHTPDYLTLGIGEIINRPDAPLIVAKLILQLDVAFALKSAARVNKGEQHKQYHPKLPNPIREDEINIYFKARDAVESSIKMVAVLERFNRG